MEPSQAPNRSGVNAHSTAAPATGPARETAAAAGQPAVATAGAEEGQATDWVGFTSLLDSPDGPSAPNPADPASLQAATRPPAAAPAPSPAGSAPAAAVAAAAADAAEGAIAAAKAQLAATAARGEAASATRPAPTSPTSLPPQAATASAARPAPSAAGLAAAPPPPQPLHFVGWRKEEYTPSGSDASVTLHRWLLHDSQGRWHLAVDTTRWDAVQQQYTFTYEAVQPFSVVKPLRVSASADVEQYLDQFIPQHLRPSSSQDQLPPAEQQTLEQQAYEQQQQQQQQGHHQQGQQQRQQPAVSSQQPGPGGAALAQQAAGVPASVAVSVEVPVPAAAGAGMGAGAAEMQAYVAGMQPAGVRRKPGRPRIHPPKQPKQPKQPQMPAGGLLLPPFPGALPVPLPVPAVAGATAAGELAAQGVSLAPADAVVTVQAKRRGRPPKTPVVAFIEDEDPRQQVYQLRLEAVLSELALLKAQCGVDYSLTLMGGPGQRQMEVHTSATANVQAAKLVRAKRTVEVPAAPSLPAVELAPPGAGNGAAAGATAAVAEEEQKMQAEEAGAVAALLSAPAAPAAACKARKREALPLAVPLLHQPQMAAFQQHLAAAHQQFLATMQAAVQQGVQLTPQLMQEWQATAMQHAATAMQQEQQQQQQRKNGGVKGTKRKGRPQGPASAADGEAAAPAKRAKTASGAKESVEQLEADVRQLARLLNDNNEAFLQGAWRREPYPETVLEEVEEFVLAEDCGEGTDAAALPSKLLSDLPPGATGGGGSDELLSLAELPLGLAAGEVDVQPVWGIDSFTRRNIWEALGCCRELGKPNTAQLDQARSHFLQRHLLPAINRQGEEGWDLMQALRLLTKSAQPEVAAAAAHLQRIVTDLEALHNKGEPCPPEDRTHFRVHPKGEGVVLLRAEGLPAGAFVGQYFGELYAAWRWLERDTRPGGRGGAGGGPHRRACLRLGTSDEFYNIVMERPPGDSRGMDVMFVNAAEKGNFTSRLCHSCDPNCKTVPMVAGGLITIGVWTTRPVAPGEELTLDWACETESEKEFSSATCLCGSPACRGSFMFLLQGDTAGPMQQYAAIHHTFLHRCQLLLRVGQEQQVSKDEEERLRQHGFKDSILTDGIPGQGGVPVPGWLRRWAALTLEFIDNEARELSVLLKEQQQQREMQPNGLEVQAAASVSDIEADVDSHKRGRLQALAFALDRAKLILRHQTGNEQQAPPLRLLSEDEAVEFLWSRDDSVARRAVATLASFTERQQADGLVQGRKPRNAGRPAWLEGIVDASTLEPPPRKTPRRGVPAERRMHSAAMLGALAAGAGRTGSDAGQLLASGVTSESPGGAELEGQHGGSARQQVSSAQERVAGQAVAGSDTEVVGDGAAEDQAEVVEVDLTDDFGGSGSGLSALRQKPQPMQHLQKGPAATRDTEAGRAQQEQQGQQRGDTGGGQGEPQEFETLAEQLESLVDDTEVTTLAEAQAALQRLAALLQAAGPGHAGLHDVLLLYASVRHWLAATDYQKFETELANGEKGGRYRPQHLWATLSCWWRAGSNTDPTAWLTNERRGCLNLPDLDCCYMPMFSSGNYARKGHRASLLKHVADSPLAPWPNNSPFSYRNPHKCRIYGSPQLDALLDGSDASLHTVLQALEQAF